MAYAGQEACAGLAVTIFMIAIGGESDGHRKAMDR
jgi:hypothetical protein